MNKKQMRATRLAYQILNGACSSYIGEGGVDSWASEYDVSFEDADAALDIIWKIRDALEHGNVEWTLDDRLRIDEIAVEFEGD